MVTSVIIFKIKQRETIYKKWELLARMGILLKNMLYDLKLNNDLSNQCRILECKEVKAKNLIKLLVFYLV